MLKIKTRFISAVVVFAVAVTAVFGTALTAAAAEGARAPAAWPSPEVSAAQSKLAIASKAVVDGYIDDEGVKLAWYLPMEANGTFPSFPDGVKYALYYTYRNNTTGAFGNWTTVVVPVQNDTAMYIIPSVAKNSTYYATILPFVDTPSRQYGKFTPYFIPKEGQRMG